MKEIVLIGGERPVVQEILTSIEGVNDVRCGRANSLTKQEELEGVKVFYNPKLIDLGTVLLKFCEIMETYQKKLPTLDFNKFKDDISIYYTSGEDVPQIEYYVKFMQMKGAEPGACLGNLIVNDTMTREQHPKILMKYSRLRDFIEADEAEQNYYKKTAQAKLPTEFAILTLQD